MRVLHSLVRRAWAPLILAAVLPMAAHAQDRVLGTWRGRVDKEMRITIRGRNVSSNTLSGTQLNGRFRLESALPREDGTIRVAVSGGRGEVAVIQQPSASNDYTAVIRMLDRNPGADSYRVTAYWTPVAASRGDRGANGRGRGNAGRNRMNGVSRLRWTGDVDADAEIRWGPNGVTQRNLKGNALRAARSSVNGGGVRQGGSVTATARVGRGSVSVVQQPSAANGWTTVIRVRDPQPGYGHYEIDVTWQ